MALSSKALQTGLSPCARPGAARVCHQTLHQRPRDVSAQGLGDFFKGMMDPLSWTPKSTRIWRLQQYEYPAQDKPDEVDELEARVNEMRRQSSPGPSGAGAVAAAEPGPQASAAADETNLPITGSFEAADDTALAKALQLRLKTLSDSSTDEDDMRASASETEAEAQEEGEVLMEEETEEVVEVVPELTGPEMRELILSKYGKTYDCSFVRRDIPGKTFVCLNIMWQHLEQRSFRLTEEQYNEKISSIAYMINVLGQTKKVREFLKAPARSQKGLPRRPVVGTAISVQLDLSPELVSEFFSAGYQ